MIPIKNKTYFLNFKTNSKDSHINYTGPGVYTGDSTLDSEGLRLFLFEELNVDIGTTEDGWFSESDIVREL